MMHNQVKQGREDQKDKNPHNDLHAPVPGLFGWSGQLVVWADGRVLLRVS
jgi:hypothetical protein